MRREICAYDTQRRRSRGGWTSVVQSAPRLLKLDTALSRILKVGRVCQTAFRSSVTWISYYRDLHGCYEDPLVATSFHYQRYRCRDASRASIHLGDTTRSSGLTRRQHEHGANVRKGEQHFPLLIPLERYSSDFTLCRYKGHNALCFCLVLPR